MSADVRYAIYFSPHPDTALWRIGCAVLGYDALTGTQCPLVPLPGLDVTARAAIAAEPARYGFHATLKAPFSLIDGADRDSLLTAARSLAGSIRSFSVAKLAVEPMGHFIALVPANTADADRLAGLADTVVRGLDHLRAPLSDKDLARRMKSPLSPRQVELLHRWGYPYTEEQFRFHMTLTGMLEPNRRDTICARLSELMDQEVHQPICDIDAISVFEQAGRSNSFRIGARFPLKSSPMPTASTAPETARLL
jgi:putative phosphonate metabolism protein